MTFVVGIALLVAIYYLCGKASQLIGVNLGLLSVAHATVLGTGAYAYALTAQRGSTAAAGAVAVAVAGAFGAGLVGLSHRVRGTEYSLFTFACQLVWFAVAANWRSVTGGALGLPDVRPIMPFQSDATVVVYLVATAALAGGVSWLWRFAESRPFMRACRIVLRSDELAATIGLPAGRMRLQIGFAYGGMLGIAGVLLASYLSIVDPSQFGISASMTILAIGLFAGVRARWLGPLVGAVLLIGVPEGSRFVGQGFEGSAFLQMTLAGAVGAAFTLLLFRGRAEAR